MGFVGRGGQINRGSTRICICLFDNPLSLRMSTKNAHAEWERKLTHLVTYKAIHQITIRGYGFCPAAFFYVIALCVLINHFNP